MRNIKTIIQEPKNNLEYRFSNTQLRNQSTTHFFIALNNSYNLRKTNYENIYEDIINIEGDNNNYKYQDQEINFNIRDYILENYEPILINNGRDTRLQGNSDKVRRFLFNLIGIYRDGPQRRTRTLTNNTVEERFLSFNGNSTTEDNYLNRLNLYSDFIDHAQDLIKNILPPTDNFRTGMENKYKHFSKCLNVFMPIDFNSGEITFRNIFTLNNNTYRISNTFSKLKQALRESFRPNVEFDDYNDNFFKEDLEIFLLFLNDLGMALFFKHSGRNSDTEARWNENALSRINNKAGIYLVTVPFMSNIFHSRNYLSMLLPTNLNNYEFNFNKTFFKFEYLRYLIKSNRVRNPNGRSDYRNMPNRTIGNLSVNSPSYLKIEKLYYHQLGKHFNYLLLFRRLKKKMITSFFRNPTSSPSSTPVVQDLRYEYPNIEPLNEMEDINKNKFYLGFKLKDCNFYSNDFIPQEYFGENIDETLIDESIGKYYLNLDQGQNLKKSKIIFNTNFIVDILNFDCNLNKYKNHEFYLFYYIMSNSKADAADFFNQHPARSMLLDKLNNSGYHLAYVNSEGEFTQINNLIPCDSIITTPCPNLNTDWSEDNISRTCDHYSIDLLSLVDPYPYGENAHPIFDDPEAGTLYNNVKDMNIDLITEVLNTYPSFRIKEEALDEVSFLAAGISWSDSNLNHKLKRLANKHGSEKITALLQFHPLAISEENTDWLNYGRRQLGRRDAEQVIFDLDYDDLIEVDEDFYTLIPPASEFKYAIENENENNNQFVNSVFNPQYIQDQVYYYPDEIINSINSNSITSSKEEKSNNLVHYVFFIIITIIFFSLLFFYNKQNY